MKIIAVFSVLASTSVGNTARAQTEAERLKSPSELGLRRVEPIYDGGLAGEWQDFGWSRREVLGPGPARIEMSGFGGWIIVRRELSGSFDALVVRFKSAALEPFLTVALSAGRNDEFPDVSIVGRHVRSLPGGELEALVPLQELNPKGKNFDRVILRANRPVDGYVQIDGLGFWSRVASATADSPSGKAPPVARRHADLAIACGAPSHVIDPMIYGIAYYPMNDAKDQQTVWSMNPGARRWGGNHTSRYNWRLGHAWNTASDWFFKNVNYTGEPAFDLDQFLAADRSHGVKTALVVPTLGWVAKDVSSYAFPVSVFGAQQATEPGYPDVGNGVRPDGTLIKPGPPSRTSAPLEPNDVREWIEYIREGDTVAQGRRVHQYILDNEPELWHVTHRDVHPQPLGYDELLERTIAYGDAIRRADPNAQIAGPASWGWTGYFYSAIDQVAGFAAKPDRRKHGDLPLLAWYLRELRAHEQRTGQRVLDVLDVHFYPQGEDIYRNGNDASPELALRRLRSVHGLWDWSYRDESWIADTIALLPRLQKLIDENYPGTKLSIGEWSFGGENHVTGGLATAEALGRFGQSKILTSAYYWTYPAMDSPSYWAFRAYRNYDGNGGRFLEEGLTTRMHDEVSLFASRDSGREKLVAVAINNSLTDAISVTTQLEACGAQKALRTFRSTADVARLTEQPRRQLQVGAPFSDVLPPGSITVYELR